MAEYTARQSAFPDEIGNTLGAFLGGLQKAHHNNIITEVEFIKTVSALDNIETKLEVGVIDSEQALTIMQSLPAIEYCDDEGFGLDTGEIEMNMRVSAHTEDKSTDSEEVESTRRFTSRLQDISHMVVSMPTNRITLHTRNSR